MRSPAPLQRPTQGHKIMKYVARAALGAIVIYAVLGHGGITVPVSNEVMPARAASNVAPNPTYWSTASTPEATPSPNHVTDGKTAPSPVPPEDPKDASRAPIAISTSDEGVKEITMDDDVDIEAFLARLLAEDGIDEDGAAAAAQPVQGQKPLTDEEKAEQQHQKDIETKAKRADITKRHTKWEKKLQEAGQEEEQDLLGKIQKMREDVVGSMRNNPEMFDLLKDMQKDGFKQIDNTDRYLTKLQKDEAVPDEETKKNWDKVVQKVSKKIDDRTIETSTYLQNRHREIMQKEKVVFETSAALIEDVANNAQTDLGMDYAWLDDVTTDDWTRYHKLKDDAKKWVEVYETIFNSTHPDMQENVLVTELLQVQTAMVRVAADLKAALDKVKLKGDLWFRGEPEKTAVLSSASSTAAAASASATTTPSATPTTSSATDAEETPLPDNMGEASTHAAQHQEL